MESSLLAVFFRYKVNKKTTIKRSVTTLCRLNLHVLFVYMQHLDQIKNKGLTCRRFVSSVAKTKRIIFNQKSVFK